MRQSRGGKEIGYVIEFFRFSYYDDSIMKYWIFLLKIIKDDIFYLRIILRAGSCRRPSVTRSSTIVVQPVTGEDTDSYAAGPMTDHNSLSFNLQPLVLARTAGSGENGGKSKPKRR